jgi:sulfonate transport system permease protein
MKRTRLIGLIASLAMTALLIAAWQWIADQRLISPVFLPPPDKAWAAFVFNVASGELPDRVMLTLRNMFYGWLIASFIGIALGSLIGISRTVRAYLGPTLEFFRPLPASAMFPVAIAFLGLSEGMVLLVIGFGALWPTLLATVNGFATVKDRLTEVARLLAMSRPKFIVAVALPNAVPEILAGMRLSLTISLLLSVTGEMLSGSEGLGHWILLQARAFHTPDLFAGVILFGVIGYLSAQLMSAVEYRLLRWRR